jgi:WD40 repeat protein
VGNSPVKYIFVNNDHVYASYADCSIGVWDKRSGQLVRTLQGFTSIISRFTIENNFIFSGCYNGSLLVWDVKSGTCVRTVNNAHSAVVRKRNAKQKN